jgi:large subunit ribosomal protein LX
MKAFQIIGTFKMGDTKNQPFTKQIVASNKKQAEEKIYSNIGGKHKIKRTLIKINKIDEISGDDITDPLVKGLMASE